MVGRNQEAAQKESQKLRVVGQNTALLSKEDFTGLETEVLRK